MIRVNVLRQAAMYKGREMAHFRHCDTFSTKKFDYWWKKCSKCYPLQYTVAL